jgi:hypothetical protein
MRELNAPPESKDYKSPVEYVHAMREWEHARAVCGLIRLSPLSDLNIQDGQVCWRSCGWNDAQQYRSRILTGSIGMEGAWYEWIDGRPEKTAMNREYEYRTVNNQIRSEGMNDRFWTAWLPGRGVPKVRHLVIEEAIAEATRIAGIEKQPVYVCECIGVATPQDPPVVWTDFRPNSDPERP